MSNYLANKSMTKYKWAWVIPEHMNVDDACYIARVHFPRLKLIEYGIDTTVVTDNSDINALLDRDVIIFLRTSKLMHEASKLNKVIGLDLMDDLFRYSYIKTDFDFILTDSLPNSRFYASRDTYYWPHAFNINNRKQQERDGTTKFVYCGNSGNVQCLLGAPLNALEKIGQDKPVSLTIITNIKTADSQQWLGSLPDINPENYKIEWIEFDKNTYEDEMRKCDVGFFPQNIEKDRWRKKSIYKIAHASSIGLPAIVSPSEEAFSTYTHNINCLIAHSASDWTDAALQMTDTEFRTMIAQNATDLCKQRFNFDLISNQLLGIAGVYLKRQKVPGRAIRFLHRRALYISKLLEHYVKAILKRI